MRSARGRAWKCLVPLGMAVVLLIAGLALTRSVGDPSAVTPEAWLSGASLPSGPFLVAYEGLGSWVDIFDKRAWGDPAAAVADMAAHGVRTLYIETGNSDSATVIRDPAAMGEFIDEAHAHGMRVVAWYLPDFASESLDLGRIRAAVGFRSSQGESFDSFALDIESAAVKSERARNRAFARLSLDIRAMVGPGYPLGAIIPSPVGLTKKVGFWDTFPYATVARTYDVVLPMGYYTFQVAGAKAVYANAIGNVRVLRAQPGCGTIPVHLIGGLAESSNGAEVAAFVRGARAEGCIGASLYGWAGTSVAEWRALRGVRAR